MWRKCSALYFQKRKTRTFLFFRPLAGRAVDPSLAIFLTADPKCFFNKITINTNLLTFIFCFFLQFFPSGLDNIGRIWRNVSFLCGNYAENKIFIPEKSLGEHILLCSVLLFCTIIQ